MDFPVVCSFCKKVRCSGQGCIRQCTFCGVGFKKGYRKELGEGHRCIVYQNPHIEKFWHAGDLEKDKKPDYKLWVYDIECAAETNDEKTLNFKTNNEGFETIDGKITVFETNSTLHIPNLLVFRNVFDENFQRIYFGPDCIEKFIEFLLNANQGRNIAIAHNASGYDNRLIHEATLKYKTPLKVKVIRNGLKFLELRVEDIKFRDSFLFLPSSLASLAASFNLPLKKGIFPHAFNKSENYNYVGQLPDKKYFDLTFFAKTDKDIEKFNEWYEERLKFSWDFKKELVDYCIDDVKILGLLVKLFHEICTEKFHHSPWFCVTAPAYVHKTVIQIVSEAMCLPEDPEERRTTAEQTRDKWAVLTPSEYWFARRCLRGGRTDVRKLYHKLSPEEIARGVKIKYVDVVSMYPAVQVKYPYPVGAPIVHIYDKSFYPCYKHQNPENSNSFENCACNFEEKFNDRMNMDV